MVGSVGTHDIYMGTQRPGLKCTASKTIVNNNGTVVVTIARNECTTGVNFLSNGCKLVISNGCATAEKYLEQR